MKKILNHVNKTPNYILFCSTFEKVDSKVYLNVLLHFFKSGTE